MKYWAVVRSLVKKILLFKDKGVEVVLLLAYFVLHRYWWFDQFKQIHNFIWDILFLHVKTNFCCWTQNSKFYKQMKHHFYNLITITIVITRSTCTNGTYYNFTNQNNSPACTNTFRVLVAGLFPTEKSNCLLFWNLL